MPFSPNSLFLSRTVFGAGFGANAGLFTVVPNAFRNSNLTGVLAIRESTNNLAIGNVTTGVGRLTYSGTFTCNSDNTGGNIQFANGQRNVGLSFDFFFANAQKTILYLVSSTPDDVYTGNASQVSATPIPSTYLPQ